MAALHPEGGSHNVYPDDRSWDKPPQAGGRTSPSPSMKRKLSPTASVGIIGTGNIGSCLARQAVAAGIPVVVTNSRGPESLADLVRALGGGARAGTMEEAAGQALIVATIPFGAYAQLPAELLEGKPVIDTMNYYPYRDNAVAELDRRVITSSELLQQHLSTAHVVKALNNVDYVRLPVIARPHGDAERAALPVAGDNADALASVVAFLDEIGYDSVVTGSLAEGWRSEPEQPVYVSPYMGAAPVGVTDPAERFFNSTAVQLASSRVLELVQRATRKTAKDPGPKMRQFSSTAEDEKA